MTATSASGRSEPGQPEPRLHVLPGFLQRRGSGMPDRQEMCPACGGTGRKTTVADTMPGQVPSNYIDDTTKADVAEAVLRADITAVGAELHRTEVTLKADIAAMRADLHVTETRLKDEIAHVEHQLLTRIGGLLVVALGLLFAALHYWPPR